MKLRMTVKITEHAFQHAKDRMQWNRVEAQAHAERAYDSVPNVSGLGSFAGRLMRVHKRAQTWSESGGAAFLFAGRVCLAIYRAEVNA